MRRRRGTLLSIAAVLAAVAVVAGIVVSSLISRRDQAVRYADARSMAIAAGCASTYEDQVAFAGVLSAGSCRVHGSVVELRVLPDVDAAYAWVEGRRDSGAEGHVVVGDGWVAWTADDAALKAMHPLG